MLLLAYLPMTLSFLFYMLVIHCCRLQCQIHVWLGATNKVLDEEMGEVVMSWLVRKGLNNFFQCNTCTIMITEANNAKYGK